MLSKLFKGFPSTKKMKDLERKLKRSKYKVLELKEKNAELKRENSVLEERLSLKEDYIICLENENDYYFNATNLAKEFEIKELVYMTKDAWRRFRVVNEYEKNSREELHIKILARRLNELNTQELALKWNDGIQTDREDYGAASVMAVKPKKDVILIKLGLCNNRNSNYYFEPKVQEKTA